MQSLSFHREEPSTAANNSEYTIRVLLVIEKLKQNRNPAIVVNLLRRNSLRYIAGPLAFIVKNLRAKSNQYGKS